MARQRPWVIEDCAIASPDEDRFDHRSVSRELLDIVRGSTQPLAIGLLGPFGSGKSSVVRLLAAELKDDPGWAILHLSAERHSGSARARGLLYGLLDEAWRQGLIGLEQWKAERACLDGGRQRTAPRPTAMSAKPGKQSWYSYPAAAGAALGWLLASLATIWLLGVAVVVFGHLSGLGASVPAWTWFAAPGARPLTTALSGAAVVACVLGTAKDGALSALKKHEITLTTPRPESTDDLEQVFSGLIDSIDRRLVIAVDDIDRLAASEVLDALTTVRSLLLTGTHRKHPPVFLLSCDEDIVREAIVGVRPGLAHRPAHQARHSSDSVPTRAAERKATEEAAQEYLNKLFTVRLVLPAHHDADLRQYIEHLLTHPGPHQLVARLGGITAVRDVLETLIHPEVRDPRHAIRLLNAFLADYGLAIRREQDNGAPAWIASGEVTGHPIALARLTVLRHDYRALYDGIRAEHDLLALLDDALLGSASALRDPLLTPYIVSKKKDDSANGSQSDSEEASSLPDTSQADVDAPPRLDTAEHPGLRYLRATAARARTGRPEHLMPLLTLGSTPASRALGSDQAAAVQRELLQRDADAFRDRLTATDMRERVLLAATHSLESARPGQDLDNTIAATVEALSRTPGLADHLDSGTDPVGRALLTLTDRIASRRTETRTPVAAHHLVGILDLVPPAHLPSLYTSLSVSPAAEPGNIPAAEQPAFTWAQALILPPAERHGRQLRPALEKYFRLLARTGGADELKAWLIDHNESSAEQCALWPPDAYRALLAMATRAADSATAQEARHAVEQASGHHQWQRPVMLGILTWLSSNDDALRVHAVELLRQRTVPADEWGSATAPDAAYGATLATELLEHAAGFLTDDEDATSSEQTAELLHHWLRPLGDRTAPSGRQISTVIAETLAQTAHTCQELAAAAARILPDLQQQDAVACVVAIADNLATPAASDNPVANALAEALLVFMRVTTDDPTAQETARTCQKALTVGLTTEEARGAFARRHLAAVMSTDAGREAGTALIDEFTPRLSQHYDPLSTALFSSLHTLLGDPATRAARLGQVLQHLYNRMNTQPTENAGFAAHYAADPAVSAQWLTWITQHWSDIPDHERSLALAAARHPDLAQSNGLPDLLVQHLLDTGETRPWQHAVDLWPAIGPNGQAALLVAEDGRCPALASRAVQASTDVLVTALGTAGTTALPPLLTLISSSPQAAQAISDYLDDAITGREWTEEHAVLIAAACPDPARLWKVLLAALSKGQSTVERVSPLIAALLTHAPAAAPRSLVDEISPVLRNATAASATALGYAVRPAPHLATALRRTLHGHSKTTAEKDRTAAFKQAAGIR
ncbi:P-loop NTPase fold protein [Streptomyces sp. HYC2]|uniref:P-loop NTPase fold protein n=1 Tax=Streptomyces sp. HYC2 TaxID=2955207 RepID=UPI00248174D4|nr:P-loop NTPase fold protein [Streptomyces sp. HYC2]